ncbi:mucin-5AC [Anopheles darlingi]|uniref:Putative class 2 transcription repressor nc2 alpha subunit drap1 n=1 Tax=Anopheles darlingi TaxID=43151 RepID=A0A2M4CI90_ANODA|nr:mucin-5AC [Anopheles darlingi]
MPSKKKKYNARFPAGRIKKIMQTDEEVGKVAQAVPVIISRTLELFVESLLTKTLKITNARNAKTLSPSHMKQCIISESRFDFLRDLVKNIPDMGINEELSGSEAGYGNDGASPASTSTSSSSNGGGAGGTAGVVSYEPQQQSHHHHRLGGGGSANSGTLQRSESYSPATASSANPYGQAPKRGLNQSGILNFYKEIPLEEEEPDNSPPAPPPKLTRLNSAPAATAIPYKIDILATGAGGNDADKQYAAGATGAPSPIGYKIEPVIKLDYSNLVSLSSDAAPGEANSGSSSTSNVVPTGNTKAASGPQPTVKIDLSRLPMTTAAASTQATSIATPKQLQLHPVPSTIVTRTTERRERQPSSTGGGGGGGSNSSQQQTASGSSTSSSSSSSPQSAPTTPIIGQSPVPTAPPIFAALSSAIPGMDEDYDDI